MIDLPDAAKKLAAEVASFADKYLGQPHVPRSPKVIHDALWGTQRLHIHEVALVDTPFVSKITQTPPDWLFLSHVSVDNSHAV